MTKTEYTHTINYKPLLRRVNWYKKPKTIQQVIEEDKKRRDEFRVKWMNSDISYID